MVLSISRVASTWSPQAKSYSNYHPFHESQFGPRILLSPAVQSAINNSLILMWEINLTILPDLGNNSSKLECEMNPLARSGLRCCLCWKELFIFISYSFFNFFCSQFFFFLQTKDYSPKSVFYWCQSFHLWN